MANNNALSESTLNPKKTIKLNPTFLKLNKTKKLYKKVKPMIAETNGGNSGNGDNISPSIIKKKLYEKINSYKNKTIKNNKIKNVLNDSSSSSSSNNLDNHDDSSNNLDDDKFNIEKQKKEFNIEFNKSLNFLQALSKKHKEEKDKNNEVIIKDTEEKVKLLNTENGELRKDIKKMKVKNTVIEIVTGSLVTALTYILVFK